MAEGQGRSSGQGVKLLYIRDYLYQHATQEHPKNTVAIIKYLSLNGIKAADKTIYNDIKQLQYEFGVPVIYDYSKKGYYITEPEFKPHELRMMVDSVQASKFITQTEAANITKKIMKLADVYTKDKLNRNAYVINRVRSSNEKVVKDSYKIYEAIGENQKIGFQYSHRTPDRLHPKQYSLKGKAYIVSPYALLWDNGNYYLYAYYGEKKKFMTFRIDRMDNITQLPGDKREGQKEFRVRQITAAEYKVFQMYRAEKKQAKVKVRFSNHLTDAVMDQFGQDVALVPIDEKHFITLLPVEVSQPFLAWIASFGHAAKILSPQWVIEEMRQFLQDAADMCNDEGEK